jgi:hypothetical protein
MVHLVLSVLRSLLDAKQEEIGCLGPRLRPRRPFARRVFRRPSLKASGVSSHTRISEQLTGWVAQIRNLTDASACIYHQCVGGFMLAGVAFVLDFRSKRKVQYPVRPRASVVVVAPPARSPLCWRMRRTRFEVMPMYDRDTACSARWSWSK